MTVAVGPAEGPAETVGDVRVTLADRFIERIYSIHGLPDSIVLDRGSQFISQFWRALSSCLEVALKPSSAFHPATNGQTERINTEMERYLRTYINWAQDDWVDWLPIAEFAGNNLVSETMGVPPFFANYGYHPRMGVEPARPCPPELSEAQQAEHFKANEIADRFRRILEYVTAQAKQAQRRYEDNANLKRSDAPRYKAGDKVLLNTENLETGRPHAKLTPLFEGPFEILKADSHRVTLKLPVNMKCSPTFHVSKVKPWDGVGIPGQEAVKERDVRANHGRIVRRTDDGEDSVEWEFEKIIGCRKNEKGRWEYRVQWAPPHNPSW